MHPIYIIPTCVGLLAAALLIIAARRRKRGLLASVLAGAVTGAGAWYVALFATVVMMSAGAHG